MKIRHLFIFIFVVTATLIVWPYFQGDSDPEVVELSESVESIVEEMGTLQQIDTSEEEDDNEEMISEDERPERSESNLIVPPEVFIEVPFVVQAPFANWEFPYKEACEEASLVMVHQFYEGKTTLSQEEMKTEIDSIIVWGDEFFGSVDTTAQESTLYLTELLGYNEDRVNIVYDMTIADMKAVLASGLPIIVPAAGRELGNKYFQTPGPLYHMLVIVGYDGNEFITNDPGTRRGEGYRYKQEVLYAAIHDLTEDLENITLGQKVMIVVEPESN